MGEAAINSGNKDAMLKALEEGSRNIQAMAPLLKPYPKLYKLALETPANAKKISADIKKGKTNPKKLNNVFKYYNGQVKSNLPKWFGIEDEFNKKFKWTITCSFIVSYY